MRADDLYYDTLNRMTQRGGISYFYDGDNHLIFDGSTRYTQNLAAPLSQMLQSVAGDGTTTSYLYGAKQLGAVTRGMRAWYECDALLQSVGE